MQLQIYQVAAFTETQFGGNPAAVVPLAAWIDDALMQKIAAENNLSETAFLVPLSAGEWHIRWFTPVVGGAAVWSRDACQCSGDSGKAEACAMAHPFCNPPADR